MFIFLISLVLIIWCYKKGVWCSWLWLSAALSERSRSTWGHIFGSCMWLQMMSSPQDGNACIRDILVSFLYSGKMRCVVHLYILSMEKNMWTRLWYNSAQWLKIKPSRHLGCIWVLFHQNLNDCIWTFRLIRTCFRLKYSHWNHVESVMCDLDV